MAVGADGNVADLVGVEVFYDKRRAENHEVEEDEKEEIVAFTNHRFSQFACKDMYSTG